MKNTNGKTKAARNGHTTELPPIDMENIVGALLATPRLLNEAKQERDRVKLDFDRYVAGLKIDSLGYAIFPAKDGEKRAAANDTERGYAVDKLMADEPDFQALKAEYKAAERAVHLYQDQLDCLQLVARLLISQAKVR